MEDFLGVPWWEDSLSFLYVENLSASSAGISGSLAFPPLHGCCICPGSLVALKVKMDGYTRRYLVLVG